MGGGLLLLTVDTGLLTSEIWLSLLSFSVWLLFFCGGVVVYVLGVARRRV